ncbi:MAG TPA: hypothetical protein VKQ32_05030 [Polyangia bacterium]|nr:hypothetical protein [Polyangia bacterium]
MSLRRSFLMLMVMVALPSIAARALARRSGSVGPADEPQVRELLSKLAAASGTPEPEERTEADLMYEAMLRWNGEPADSKTIDRVLDQSKKDAARTKRVMVDKVRHMFWKDPFSDDPHRLIPVRQEDRDLLDSYARKSERSGAREARAAREPRDEVTRLREEVSRLRAENARIRERADAASGGQCVADSSSSDERRHRRHVLDGSTGGSVHSHHGGRPAAQIALVSTAMTTAEDYTPPSPSPNVIPAHGIIIERLPSPPAPPVESGRRHGSRVR